MSKDSLVILDLEATCWNDELGNNGRAMEAIEIGAVHATVRGEVLDAFKTFIKPVINPVLSEFCTSLTGITQSDVDGAPNYSYAISAFDAWFGKTGCSVWSSWGAYDKKQLVADSLYHAFSPNFLEFTHINLKKPWKKSTKSKRDALRAALDFHGLAFDGKLHRALDDTLNIVRLLPFIDRNILDEEIFQASGQAEEGQCQG